ncbi:MAG: cytochrome P450 [Leptolyngbyaceae cyanobacterium MO_188.B28]|nr:cytochrome P450 [Leptolyngbyaceae cyanobacterium MO_188.B28]
MKRINELRTPAFFQKLQWVADPVGYMEGAAQRYPDLFESKVADFGDSVLFVQHPQALEQILTNDRKIFSAPGHLNEIVTPLVGDYSIMLLDGERHRRERKLLMPSFHGDRMHTYGKLIEQLVERTLIDLTPGKTFTALSVTQNITLQVIIKVVFGLEEGERCQKIIQLTRSFLNFLNTPLTASFLFFNSLQKDLGPWSPWGFFLRTRNQLDDLLYAEIRDRRQNIDPERVDILSLLMSVRDDAGEALTDQELRDELMTFLLAGHDTTALALAWGLYWIHHHPEVREKLLQELDSLGQNPDPMRIFRLPYLTAVCNETLRIHPIGMLTFPRVAQEPVELLGHKLEPGTCLLGCLYLIHQREDLYPEPKKFNPERFLERQFSPHEFIPFGSGVRRCMGEALAQFEMKLVIAKILSKAELALANNRSVKPQRRGVVLAPAGGVKMVFLQTRHSAKAEERA